MDIYDVVVIGAGPGGLACTIKAKELGLRCVILEKGTSVLQGIIDHYPKGKTVYPTIPKGESGKYAVGDLEPVREPVEDYLAKIRACVEKYEVPVQFGQEFKEIVKENREFKVVTTQDHYMAYNVILAFGRNVPADLAVYGEADMVARRLHNPENHIGDSTLVIGGGNAAADVVAALSKAKREADDDTPVYWAHRREQFRVEKDVARDLGEEILLGGYIRILQEAIPLLGGLDRDGVQRLFIVTRTVDLEGDMRMHEGLSFPMKHVIACIGNKGPAPIFEALGLRQITSSEISGKEAKAGKKETMFVELTPEFQTSIKGIYAIGAAISPAYVIIQEDGTLEKQKHPDLIFAAVRDGVRAMEDIARRKSETL
ncbi:MAG: NAD(P)-binding domain-containing protein [Deltaproteobacteria bacterium]|nr:NAD(P)-binding domain-containing protein [Deltaproteobacteria bacterium]